MEKEPSRRSNEREGQSSESEWTDKQHIIYWHKNIAKYDKKNKYTKNKQIKNISATLITFYTLFVFVLRTEQFLFTLQLLNTL